MDDIRIGRILRALRRRRGLTQGALAARIGLTQQAVSLIERGHGSRLAGATMRRVFAALDARWEGTVSWRGGDLDRLVDGEHARLVGEVVRRLQADGWEAAVEVTYSEFGERGSIDVLGGRRDVGAAVVVEVKSDLTVVDATVRKLDEKARLVRRSIGRERLGWQPRTVGRLLVLPATGAARRRVAGAAAVLDAALPVRGRDIPRWLRSPHGDLAGVQFVPNTNPGGDRRVRGGAKRVRPAARSVPAAQMRARRGEHRALHNSRL